MKTLMTLITSLFASVSLMAMTPSRELVQVTRALVNNPSIVAQLKKNNSDHLSDYKIKAIKQGVYQYELVFKRQCECMPSTATVTIIEDLTPTYSDGAIKYQSSVAIQNGN